MKADPRAALAILTASLERHLEASASRRGENDPTVVAAYQTVADAFDLYDDALLESYGEVTPLEIYSGEDGDEDDDDDGEDGDEVLDDHGTRLHLVRAIGPLAQAQRPVGREVQRRGQGVTDWRSQDGGLPGRPSQQWAGFLEHQAWKSFTFAAWPAASTANLVSPVSGLTATK